MSDDVDDPWSDTVDVTEMMDRDFQHRNGSITLWDPDHANDGLIEALSEAHGLNHSEVLDRATRVYAAHVLDVTEGDDLRAEYEITNLLPPRGWVEASGRELFPEVDPVEYRRESDGQSISTPQTVSDIVGDLIEAGRVDADSKSEFVMAAITFLANGAE